MVGFIAGEHRIAEKTAWIATLAVHPVYRRRGIATALLVACEDLLTLPRIRLTVRVENVAAQELYRKSGYHKVGIWPKYYSGGGDALLLEKENPNSVQSQ
jgi:ribosomal-protein-alanine N-acetyltransferase